MWVHHDKRKGFTMAMSVKDFLLLYFRQLHFDSMPEPKQRQFDSYVAKDDFRGDMKSWRDDLLKKGADGKPYKGPDGHYVHNDLPDGLNGETAMSDKDWSDLYMALYNALNRMNNGKKSFADVKDKDKDGEAAVKFLNKYFGDNNVFIPLKLEAGAKTEINDLLKLIDESSKNNDEKDLSSLLELTSSENKQLKDLIDKPDDFDKTENRDLIEKITRRLDYELQWGENIADDSPLRKINFKKIRDALRQEKEPNQADLARLQSAYSNILRELYNQPKVFSIFSEYDDKGKISGPYHKALENTDFDGKIKEANFIKPKYDDTLDWRERLEKNTKDLYDDTLKKYMTAHRDHIYAKDTAKAIGGVMVGMAINPNDGIGAILEKKDKIIDKLRDKQPLKAIDHFKWFIEAMEEFSKNGKTKEIEGALRDGDKMNHLVEDMAIRAIDEAKNGKKDAIDKAKTAMEILKVMQQPMFSGRALDAIRKTDFKLFSDSGLSFNKSNENVQRITNAVDATLGTTIKGIALLGTGMASLYNRRNLGFNKSGKLEKKHQERAQEKSLFAQEIQQKNLDDAAKITDLYYEQQKSGIKNGTDLADKEKRLDNARKRLKKLEKDRALATEQFKQYETMLEDFDEYDKLMNQNNKLADEAKDLKEKLESMPGVPGTQMDVLAAEKAKAAFESKAEEWKKVVEQLAAINSKYGSFDNLRAQVHSLLAGGDNGIYGKAKAEKERLDGAVDKKETQIEKLEQKISAYKAADTEMDFYEKAIEQRNEKLATWDEDNKDYYYELMGFWDFLQTGHTKNIWRLSTKRAQKRMDEKVNGQRRMDKIIDEFMHDHGYAA